MNMQIKTERVFNPATYNPGSPGSAVGDAPVSPHWSQMITCSDGRCVFGYGPTKADAENDAVDKAALAETEIASPPKRQIRLILARYPGNDRIYEGDRDRLFKLFGKLLTE